jgi:Ca-activated chloride channel homolog
MLVPAVKLMAYLRYINRVLAFVVLLSALISGDVIVSQAQETPRSPEVTRPQRGRENSQEAKTAEGPESNKEQQEEEVVRIDTDLANILFTATDKNKRFVTGLRREDVRVLEDGVEQEVFTFERQTELPLSLAVLIDVSASQEVTLPLEKMAAASFIGAVLRPNKDKAAVISFTGDATLEQELTDDRTALRRAIDRVEIVFPLGYLGRGVAVPTGPPVVDSDPRAGSTAIWDAVWVTSDEILNQVSGPRRRAIILLTDGVDTSSLKKRQEAVDRAVQADVTVYTIGIGDSENYHGIEKDTLRKLSERTGGRAFFPKNDIELRSSFAQIEQELRAQYLIAYSPKNRKRDGTYRKVEIEVINPEMRKQKLRLSYRQGYFAKPASSVSTPAAPMQKP